MPAGGLSGGNVQRMILARELAHAPRLIVAFYPTRGLDVRSAIAARASSSWPRDAGAGVLLISEDLDELFAAERPPRGPLPRPDRGHRDAADTTMEEIGYLMTGEPGAP